MPITTSGNYKFVFSSGTFDETFGQAAGASLYIDDILVTGTSTSLEDYSDVASILTRAKANSANSAVEAALEKVSLLSTKIGAYENRLSRALDSAMSQQSLKKEALSKVSDTDYANESASLLKSQILREAGLNILDEAKLTPEIVLKLLE